MDVFHIDPIPVSEPVLDFRDIKLPIVSKFSDKFNDFDGIHFKLGKYEQTLVNKKDASLKSVVTPSKVNSIKCSHNDIQITLKEGDELDKQLDDLLN